MSKRTRFARWRPASLAVLGALLLAGMAATGCSGNSRVSVGGSVHMGSGGRWGHSLSVGIHSHGRRR